MGEGTQAQLAPALGCPIFSSSIFPSRSGIAHMPFPICAFPVNPHARPMSTLRFSYAVIQGCAFMFFLRTNGPACAEERRDDELELCSEEEAFCIPRLRTSMLVWISSPVLSKNPVLMNATLDEAAAMQALRLVEVLLLKCEVRVSYWEFEQQ